MNVKISSIQINGRHRRDLGDVRALADSIEALGLLQPIVLGPKRKLLAGERRIAAYQLLGRTTIPVTVVKSLSEAAQQLAAERDENVCRKDFGRSEAYALGQSLWPLAEAEARARHGGDHKGNQGNFPQLGKTRDIIGTAVGLSGKTYEAVGEIVEAAKEDPALDEIVQEMDQTGNVNRALRKVRSQQKRKQVEEIAKQLPKTPEGKFDVLVIDPPWPMEKIERDCRPNQSEMDYPTMNEAELLEWLLPREKAARDCHVFLWTTHRFLPLAFECLKAWCFEYSCTFVWRKPGGFQPIGMPQFNCEFCLYARQGAPEFIETKNLKTCFAADRRKHSEKPDAFYKMVVGATAGRRLDMFNRRAIPGFIGWGKEAVR